MELLSWTLISRARIKPNNQAVSEKTAVLGPTLATERPLVRSGHKADHVNLSSTLLQHSDKHLSDIDHTSQTYN